MRPPDITSATPPECILVVLMNQFPPVRAWLDSMGCLSPWSLVTEFWPMECRQEYIAPWLSQENPHRLSTASHLPSFNWASCVILKAPSGGSRPSNDWLYSRKALGLPNECYMSQRNTDLQIFMDSVHASQKSSESPGSGQA